MSNIGFYKAAISADETATIKEALKMWPKPTEALAIIERLEKTFDLYEPRAVEVAQSLYNRDGEVEIDDGAVCSRGDDNGLYVQAWVWVADSDLDRA